MARVIQSKQSIMIILNETEFRLDIQKMTKVEIFDTFLKSTQNWLEMPYFHQMEATSSIFYKLDSFPVPLT